MSSLKSEKYDSSFGTKIVVCLNKNKCKCDVVDHVRHLFEVNKIFTYFFILSELPIFCLISYNNKLVKNCSLPLAKVTIFQKLLHIVELKEHQEEPTHLSLILIPNL